MRISSELKFLNNKMDEQGYCVILWVLGEYRLVVGKQNHEYKSKNF